MRIAYITPYQGPTLPDRRPIVRNRSLSNSVKIELIASLLVAASHDVEVISQGEVVENSWTFYPAFSEPKRFHPQIPVAYASALPVRRLNGLLSSLRTLQIFRARHRAAPFDAMMIFNLKEPQLVCAQHAIRRLDLPVVLEYEDDRFVDVGGNKSRSGPLSTSRDRWCRKLLAAMSGCMAVSPHLLAQLPPRVPQLLLRGVIGADVLQAGRSNGLKLNRVCFSGTHVKSNGVAELIDAWRALGRSDWELHITGYGELTDTLRAQAAGIPGVVFHGLVSRPKLVELISSAKICINPHAVSQTPGNVFAFKIIEYLAAGAHVVTTPMGALESELEAGVTYMPDNTPPTIAATLRQAIESHHYERRAPTAAQATFGPDAVSRSLDALLRQAVTRGPQTGTRRQPVGQPG